MNTSNNNLMRTPTRQAAITGLAVVGFVALIMLGISLAVYSTRFVPTVVNRVGSAAVYLGSIFVPAPSTLSVVQNSNASTTILFGPADSAPAVTPTVTTTTVVLPVQPKKIPTTTAGANSSNTYQIGTTTANVALSGLPDLVTNISAVGYLTSPSTDSFVASSTVPSGMRPAVKFTIKNIGTNITGTWRFSASIPTQSSYLFYSPSQQSLAPGESIDYTLGFDQPIAGTGKMISVSANFDHMVTESNFNNNSATGYVTVMGS